MPLTTIGTAAIDDNAITTAKIAADTVVAADIAANAITASELADDAVDTAAIADLAVTAAKIAATTITTAKIAADAIDGTKLADNAVNSEHYTDGSIDTVHIADNQVTLAKMAGLARGKIIIGDASGDPAALTVGSNGQALVSNGTDISWGSAGASVSSANTWTAGQRGEITALTSATTITPNFADSNHFSVTLAHNATFANPSNLTAGQTGSIFITQDGTGSRTGSWGTYWDFIAGTAPTLTTTAAAVDRIDYVVRSSSSIHAIASLNLS